MAMLCCMAACTPPAAPAEVQKEPENPLIGSWELSYVDLVFPDTVLRIDSTQFYSVYSISPKHFSFFYASPDKKELINAGYGRYSSYGDIYIEHIEFHSFNYIIGTSVIFDSEVQGDTWKHDGYLPVREEEPFFAELAKGDPTFRIIEVRRRVK